MKLEFNKMLFVKTSGTKTKSKASIKFLSNNFTG